MKVAGTAGEKRRHNQKLNINQNKNEPRDRTVPPYQFFFLGATLGGPLEMSKCYFCRVTYIGRERNRFQGPNSKNFECFPNKYSVIKASVRREAGQLKLLQLIYLFLVRSNCGICHCRSK